MAMLPTALMLSLAAALPQGGAPDLDGGTGWFNTDKPVRLADLKGKIVILDFWTYCCINCMHVIPTLHRLEKKYAKELVVVGVHSAKFENEKDSENIRQAILRHDIEHPVVNDSEMKIFRAFNARGWPHFVIFDPEGKVAAADGGEIPYESFVGVIDGLIRKHEGKIDRREMTWKPEKAKEKPGTLAFPGKILAVPGRLFIADTKHHRILECGLDGAIRTVIGSGQEGFKDGGFAEARFDEPQGLALVGDLLYVADRENHAIRVADLKARTVTTVAGTGKQGWKSDPGHPLKTALNSPWDVLWEGGRLIIAMAGNHQLWTLDPKAGKIGVLSGTGRETLVDGAHESAAYSQPSGLALGDGKVYVADSEISAVREVDPRPDGKVRTLVGTGLFDFGDKDGVGDAALLQHTIGLTWWDGLVYVADSYNHKIKAVDPKTREVKTVFGTGKRGNEDGEGKAARFFEPNGISALDGRLYVADTNNHRIRVADLKTGRVSTLEVR
jgi:thiol-disulfide isomerase/thioredoxin